MFFYLINVYMFRQKRYLIGGGLKASTLQALLDASYSGVGNVEGFILDKKISSKTAKVYVPPTGQVVVAHTGTYNTKDWLNNGVYGIGGETAYRQTSRFKSSEKVQKTAEKKYGAKNVSTIGHSQATRNHTAAQHTPPLVGSTPQNFRSLRRCGACFVAFSTFRLPSSSGWLPLNPALTNASR